MKLNQWLAKCLLPDYEKNLEQKENQVNELERSLSILHCSRNELIESAKEEKLEIQAQLQDYENEHSNLMASMNSLIKMAIASNISYKDIYTSLQAYFDLEGFRLYFVAKKITGIEISNFYPTEENLGYFEDIDGFERITWLEQAAFGKITWCPMNPPYEKAEFGILDTSTEQYLAYEKELYQKTVEELVPSSKKCRKESFMKYKQSEMVFTVNLCVKAYANNCNLFLILYEKYTGEEYMRVTTSPKCNLPPYYAFVKNYGENEGVEAFIEENNLGKRVDTTEIIGNNDIELPLYLFDKERLMEIAPERTKKYETLVQSLPKPKLAMIHSLEKQDTIERIFKLDGDNKYVAKYNNMWYTAIFNPFTNLYYVDDKFGALSEEESRYYEKKL